MAFTRIMLALLFNHLPHPSSSSQAKNSLRVPRMLAFLSYLVTAVFFFSSNLYSSLQTWIPIVFFIISAIPLLPLPALNLETRLKNMLLYAIFKSLGSFACNYLFNWIGSAIKMETDLLLMNASLSFAFFLIMIDYVYDIDEDVGLCDGFFFAGFGLMSSQKVIPQYLVLIVGSSLCFLKTYLPLYKKQSSGGINEVEELAAKDSGDSGDVPAEDKGSVVFTVPGVSGEEATIRQRLVKKEQEMQEIQMQCKNIYTHADDIDF